MPVRRGMRMRSTSRVPTTIVVSPSTLTLGSGTYQLTAAVYDQVGTLMPGTQPDAWHSANTGVATVNSTGLLTFVANGGPMNVTASLTTSGGTITSNACAVTGASTSEPVFNAGTDTMRYQDDFTKYTSAHEMYLDRADGTMRFGQTDATADPVANEDVSGVLLLSPGRDGVTGKMVRFVYGGVTFDESHSIWLRGMPTLPDSTINVYQHWARPILSSTMPEGGGGSGLSIKWFMNWFRSSGVNAGLRNEWATHNYSPGPFPPAGIPGALWLVYDTAATSNQAHQPVPPYATTIFNSSSWHRFTYRYRSNTTPGSPSSRDGFSQMWVDGVKIIDISAATVGVTPPGGWKTWCEYDDLDALGSTFTDFLKIMANLTDSPGFPFTVDWTEFSWWTQP